jgi:hypothetical protein
MMAAFNARVETIETKPFFFDAERTRCLIRSQDIPSGKTLQTGNSLGTSLHFPALQFGEIRPGSGLSRNHFGATICGVCSRKQNTWYSGGYVDAVRAMSSIEE